MCGAPTKIPTYFPQKAMFRRSMRNAAVTWHSIHVDVGNERDESKCRGGMVFGRGDCWGYAFLFDGLAAQPAQILSVSPWVRGRVKTLTSAAGPLGQSAFETSEYFRAKRKRVFEIRVFRRKKDDFHCVLKRLGGVFHRAF